MASLHSRIHSKLPSYGSGPDEPSPSPQPSLKRKRKRKHQSSSPKPNPKRRKSSPKPILNEDVRKKRMVYKQVEKEACRRLTKIVNNDFPVTLEHRRKATGQRHPNNYLIEASMLASCCIERERQAMLYTLDHQDIQRKICANEFITKKEMKLIGEDARHMYIIRRMHRAIDDLLKMKITEDVMFFSRWHKIGKGF